MKVKLPAYYATEWLRNEVLTWDDRRSLRQVRGGADLCWDVSERDPLVTIRIATYNTGRIVAERALASAVAQSYENIEILVIGDHCDDETVEAVRSVDDARIRFINLPARGLYPEIPHLRRKVAGAHPMNIGIALASGAWIAPCDDDDEMTSDHVEVLLAAARESPYEMVWSRAESERSPGEFRSVGSPTLQRGQISHGTVLYRSELRFMTYSLSCWKRREPSDWNLWRRMRRAGVRMGYTDQLTYRYFLSEAGRTQRAALTDDDAGSIAERS